VLQASAQTTDRRPQDFGWPTYVVEVSMIQHAVSCCNLNSSKPCSLHSRILPTVSGYLSRSGTLVQRSTFAPPTASMVMYCAVLLACPGRALFSPEQSSRLISSHLQHLGLRQGCMCHDIHLHLYLHVHVQAILGDSTRIYTQINTVGPQFPRRHGRPIRRLYSEKKTDGGTGSQRCHNNASHILGIYMETGRTTWNVRR
jgi:hypothetical protein